MIKWEREHLQKVGAKKLTLFAGDAEGIPIMRERDTVQPAGLEGQKESAVTAGKNERKLWNCSNSF